MKDRLLVCMSGGRTSAYMTHKLLKEQADEYEIVVCFANTGQENNETLDFVNQCDENFNFNTVWMEAIVHHGERKSSTHRIVNYNTASRQGEPFEEMIIKYGLPNAGKPFCTRELKENPIHSYVRSIGWKPGSYYTALGIRNDEPRRIRRNITKQNKIYPLVDLFPTDKKDVIDFWSSQSFDLQLEDYQGNCKWCYKKSTKKLLQIIKDDVSNFDFPIRMENEYGKVGRNSINGVVVKEPRTLFRNYMTGEKMIELYKELQFEQLPLFFDSEELEGCAESCEAFVEGGLE
jgi:hypothetical protein